MKFLETTLNDIPLEFRDYLNSVADRSKGEQIPVYYQPIGSEDIFWIKDYVLKDNSVFERTAPTGLWRGGGVLLLKTKNGYVTLFDERYNWLKMPGGVAKFSEGNSLRDTAIREAVVEELVVLKSDETERLVPMNLRRDVDRNIKNWDITVQNVRGCGTIKDVDYFFNQKNKCMESVIIWDLSDEKTDLVILHNEDWFRGGDTGFATFVINNDGNIVGIYDGRHGFVKFPIPAGGITLHETLAKVIGDL
ncbi:MAG: hypothetical protein WCJ36_00435 [Candidatus Saccharibacteria bacterium]